MQLAAGVLPVRSPTQIPISMQHTLQVHHTNPNMETRKKQKVDYAGE
jgi:hypothetical protein